MCYECVPGNNNKNVGKLFGVTAGLCSPELLFVICALKGPLLLKNNFLSNIQHLDIVFSLFFSNIQRDCPVCERRTHGQGSGLDGKVTARCCGGSSEDAAVGGSSDAVSVVISFSSPQPCLIPFPPAHGTLLPCRKVTVFLGNIWLGPESSTQCSRSTRLVTGHCFFLLYSEPKP